MRALGWREATLAFLPLAGVLVPNVAAGQAGFYVTPSFSVAEVYDDNVFSTPSQRKTDLISRFSPGIKAGYQSTPLTLLGSYTFDAEVFSRNPELTTAQARQEVSVELRYLPTRLLTLSFKGAYAETQTPGELNVETGLAAGRVRAQRFTLNPALASRFDPLTTGTVEYMFTEDTLSGGVTTDTYTASLVLDRRVTPRDTGSVGYTFQQFVFGADGTTTSHAFTLGWTHELTPVTTIALRGGPRVSEGSVGPEVSASVRHRLQTGEVSFTYSRSQTTTIGLAGTVDTERFDAGVTSRLLAVLLVHAAPSFARSTSAGLEVKVYGLNADATYQLTRWLSLQAAYAFSFQQGTLGATRDQEISHNIIILRLTATYPSRLY